MLGHSPIQHQASLVHVSSWSNSSLHVGGPHDMEGTLANAKESQEPRKPRAPLSGGIIYSQFFMDLQGSHPSNQLSLFPGLTDRHLPYIILTHCTYLTLCPVPSSSNLQEWIHGSRGVKFHLPDEAAQKAVLIISDPPFAHFLLLITNYNGNKIRSCKPHF